MARIIELTILPTTFNREVFLKFKCEEIDSQSRRGTKPFMTPSDVNSDIKSAVQNFEIYSNSTKFGISQCNMHLIKL